MCVYVCTECARVPFTFSFPLYTWQSNIYNGNLSNTMLARTCACVRARPLARVLIIHYYIFFFFSIFLEHYIFSLIILFLFASFFFLILFHLFLYVYIIFFLYMFRSLFKTKRNQKIYYERPYTIIDISYIYIYMYIWRYICVCMYII